MDSKQWLMNVLLETGFHYENGHVVATKTELVHLLIEEGKITKMTPQSTKIEDDVPKQDANGLLALPSFVEKHCHLDKTLLGDKWTANIPAPSIFDRFEIEKERLPQLEVTMEERASILIDTMLKSGVTHIRTHVDLYPEVGLNYLETIKKALARYEGKLTHEIVAFPQHGLLRTNASEIVKEALTKGATLVGGVDPASVDGDMEKSVKELFNLANLTNSGIDLHLHDRGEVGLTTIKEVARLTVEYQMQGRVAISHAFALADMVGEEAKEIMLMLAEAKVAIISSVPLGDRVPPLPTLDEHQVEVAIGCDNIYDSWSPFGNGDILERLGRFAQRFNYVTEQKLATSLKFITNGVTPLNEQGVQVWPAIGMDANMVLVSASCSAEAVARRSERRATIFKGNIVAGCLSTKGEETR
ncbi:amidohydrolase [Viridibacillus arvi]|uniref:amidohydrolase n=1 Tax=Viridibacillus arvi TaxID=263475 RepID=UPI00187B7F56|nr:amidohydrolase [Viridibacillus sp. JNUCC-6]QOV11995.1 amidohydrolase family protein [Viridibacillus sp. JNUCC-6]